MLCFSTYTLPLCLAFPHLSYHYAMLSHTYPTTMLCFPTLILPLCYAFPHLSYHYAMLSYACPYHYALHTYHITILCFQTYTRLIRYVFQHLQVEWRVFCVRYFSYSPYKFINCMDIHVLTN